MGILKLPKVTNQPRSDLHQPTGLDFSGFAIHRKIHVHPGFKDPLLIGRFGYESGMTISPPANSNHFQPLKRRGTTNYRNWQLLSKRMPLRNQCRRSPGLLAPIFWIQSRWSRTVNRFGQPTVNRQTHPKSGSGANPPCLAGEIQCALRQSTSLLGKSISWLLKYVLKSPCFIILAGLNWNPSKNHQNNHHHVSSSIGWF